MLYLFAIGVGVGQLIDSFEFNGRTVAYATFIAPGMLAASAMNGAIMDATFGIFFKLRYDKVYEGVLATPMRTLDIARGELTWSLLRSACYSLGFLLVVVARPLERNHQRALRAVRSPGGDEMLDEPPLGRAREFATSSGHGGS